MFRHKLQTISHYANKSVYLKLFQSGKNDLFTCLVTYLNGGLKAVDKVTFELTVNDVNFFG